MKWSCITLSVLFLVLASWSTVGSAQDICDDRAAAEGEETILECQCPAHQSGVSRRDNKSSNTTVGSVTTCADVIIQWFFDNDQLIGFCNPTDSGIEPPFQDSMTITSDEELVIFSADRQNTGLYRCYRFEVTGHHYYTQLDVGVPPVDVKIQDITDDIVEDQPVDVQCVIDRVMPISDVTDVHWTKPSSTDPAGEPEEVGNEDGTYTLTYTTPLNFTRVDNGQSLTCHVQWKGEDDYSTDSRTVQVQFSSPSINFTSTVMPQPEGSELKFACSGGSSNPDSHVEWTLNGVDITNNATQYQRQGDYNANSVTSELDLTASREMDKQLLRCDIMYEGTAVAGQGWTLNITWVCEDLSGTWLAVETDARVIFIQDDDNVLTGTFTEESDGGWYALTGRRAATERTMGFTVIGSAGSYVTSWSGQCYYCLEDTAEVLHLRSNVYSLDEASPCPANGGYGEKTGEELTFYRL